MKRRCIRAAAGAAPFHAKARPGTGRRSEQDERSWSFPTGGEPRCTFRRARRLSARHTWFAPVPFAASRIVSSQPPSDRASGAASAYSRFSYFRWYLRRASWQGQLKTSALSIVVVTSTAQPPSTRSTLQKPQPLMDYWLTRR